VWHVGNTDLSFQVSNPEIEGNNVLVLLQQLCLHHVCALLLLRQANQGLSSSQLSSCRTVLLLIILHLLHRPGECTNCATETQHATDFDVKN